MQLDFIQIIYDVPFSDTFQLEGKWEVTPGNTINSCKLNISISVVFLQKTLFKCNIRIINH